MGKYIIEIGISSAIINFNDGASGMHTVLKNLRLHDGYFTNLYSKQHDTSRVKVADRKSTLITKQRRKKLRAIRKGFQDKKKEIEGEFHAPCEF